MQQQEILSDVQGLIDGYMAATGEVKVLEAGCGSRTFFDFRRAHLTGLDISEKQLARNTGLDAALLGDIQYYPLPEAHFDIVVSWDVMEHLTDVRGALDNLSRALRRDGLLIVKVPNYHSLKGMVTRWTPYWFHVWFYRHVLRVVDAGRGDTAPFRSYFRYEISRNGIRRYAEGRELKVVYCRTFERYWQGNWRIAAVNRIVQACCWPLRVATVGRVRLTDSQFIVVLQKP